jgi:orotidine-5'-phosphate decarboxylase
VSAGASGEPAPIAVALDAPDRETAVNWARAVAPHVGVLKVGLELFSRYGPPVVEAVRSAGGDVDLFLDVKLHDIPATVAGAARALAGLQPRYLTVHAAGGPSMVRAAAEAAPDARIAAVTVLTSLSGEDLDAIGLVGPPLVCSPQEVAAVRAEVDADVTLITPGVRPAGSGAQDQARVATPQQALADGADLLVIGRPITGAADPGPAAAELAASLRR